MRCLQGCQFPDFSLRSRTFCYTAQFSATFSHMLFYQDFFSHSTTKPPASTLEFKNFDSILEKNFCDFRQKREKRPHPAGSRSWASLWPAVTCTLCTS